MDVAGSRWLLVRLVPGESSGRKYRRPFAGRLDQDDYAGEEMAPSFRWPLDPGSRKIRESDRTSAPLLQCCELPSTLTSPAIYLRPTNRLGRSEGSPPSIRPV